MPASDFLLGLFTVAVVVFIAYAAYPVAVAALGWLLKRKWGRR